MTTEERKFRSFAVWLFDKAYDFIKSKDLEKEFMEFALKGESEKNGTRV